MVRHDKRQNSLLDTLALAKRRSVLLVFCVLAVVGGWFAMEAEWDADPLWRDNARCADARIFSIERGPSYVLGKSGNGITFVPGRATLLYQPVVWPRSGGACGTGFPRHPTSRSTRCTTHP